ncbi:MAG: hypothetical protein ACREJ4_08935 [Candidatus Methylomirabilaceae bacterium]
MRRSMAFCAAGALMVAVGCGPPGPSSLALPTGDTPIHPPPAAAGPQHEWDNPILGIAMPNLAEASSKLAFNPLVPKALGNPTKILVQLGNLNLDRRPIAMIFDHPSYGRVIVKEGLPEGTPEQEMAFLASVPKMGAECCAGIPGSGHSELVAIRGSITALVTETDDRSIADITWVEGGLLLNVSGPDLQRQEVIAIANAL